MKVGPVLILVLFICSIAQSQARHEQPGASAANSLTVTATVAPSVWLVMEPDGRQDMVVANAPDSKESFSHSSAKAHRKSPAQARKQNSSIAKPQQPLHEERHTSVRFDFPTVSKQFDVTQKTVIMNVSEGGKTVARPVTVTTIVAQ